MPICATTAVGCKGYGGHLQEGSGGGQELPRALPPALVGSAVAVGYGALRLCGNPCCGTYTGAAEAGLHLKQCAGCNAVAGLPAGALAAGAQGGVQGAAGQGAGAGGGQKGGLMMPVTWTMR